jgi:hypothetical protein
MRKLVVLAVVAVVVLLLAAQFGPPLLFGR